jgi:hypothetical protein
MDARKHLVGLGDEHPYEAFAESLAAALDLREKETGLHSNKGWHLLEKLPRCFHGRANRAQS